MVSKRKKALASAANEATRYKKLAKSNKTGRIGLGLESTFKPKRIKRSEVVLDEQTSTTEGKDKSIIYAAGWSLSEQHGEDNQA